MVMRAFRLGWPLKCPSLFRRSIQRCPKSPCGCCPAQKAPNSPRSSETESMQLHVISIMQTCMHSLSCRCRDNTSMQAQTDTTKIQPKPTRQTKAPEPPGNLLWDTSKQQTATETMGIRRPSEGQPRTQNLKPQASNPKQ